MKKADFEQINSVLKDLKRKIILEVDEMSLITLLNNMSLEIEKLKKEKDSFEKTKKLLDLINSEYGYMLSDYQSRVNIPKLKKELDESIKESIKQIMYKSEKYDNYKLLYDFISDDKFLNS